MEKDLRAAYDVFALLATRRGYAFSGLMMGGDPASLFIIGNCSEHGHDLADLHRTFASVVDSKADAGRIAPMPEPGPAH